MKKKLIVLLTAIGLLLTSLGSYALQVTILNDTSSNAILYPEGYFVNGVSTTPPKNSSPIGSNRADSNSITFSVSYQYPPVNIMLIYNMYDPITNQQTGNCILSVNQNQQGKIIPVNTTGSSCNPFFLESEVSTGKVLFTLGRGSHG